MGIAVMLLCPYKIALYKVHLSLRKDNRWCELCRKGIPVCGPNGCGQMVAGFLKVACINSETCQTYLRGSYRACGGYLTQSLYQSASILVSASGLSWLS